MIEGVLKPPMDGSQSPESEARVPIGGDNFENIDPDALERFRRRAHDESTEAVSTQFSRVFSLHQEEKLPSGETARTIAERMLDAPESITTQRVTPLEGAALLQAQAAIGDQLTELKRQYPNVPEHILYRMAAANLKYDIDSLPEVSRDEDLIRHASLEKEKRHLEAEQQALLSERYKEDNKIKVELNRISGITGDEHTPQPLFGPNGLLDPDHPYGPDAALGRLPQAGIPEGAIVNQIREIPRRLDQSQLLDWVENTLRDNEKTGLYDPAFVSTLSQLAGTYQLRGGYTPEYDRNLGRFKTRQEFFWDLSKKIQVRGGLVQAEGSWYRRNWGGLAESFGSIYIPDNMRVLLTDKWGIKDKITVAGREINLGEEVCKIMAMNDGAYWRGETVPDPLVPGGTIQATQLLERFLDSVKILDTANAVVTRPDLMKPVPPGGALPTPPTTDGLTVEEKKLVQNNIERFLKGMGVVTFYTGPTVTDPATGRPILLDRLIMNQTDALPTTVPAYDRGRRDGERRWMKNENYWNLWHQYRRDHTVPASTFKDESSLGRFIDSPSHLHKENNTKAVNLRNTAGELYFRDYLHYNGLDNMDQFIDIVMKRPVRVMGQNVDENDLFSIGRFSQQLTKAAEAQSLMTSLMDGPIRGEGKAGENLNNDLKPVLDVIGKFNEYLRSGATPNIQYLAAGHLMEAVFEYINGNSPDRLHEFLRVPNFGPIKIHDVFKALEYYIDMHHREESLHRLRADESTVQKRELRGDAWGLFKDLSSQFIKAILS